MISFFFFLTKQEINYAYASKPFGVMKLGYQQGMIFNITEGTETVYFSTQKYIYNGNLTYHDTNPNMTESIPYVYNKSRIYTQPFNISNDHRNGVSFTGYWWILNSNDNGTNCARSYSILNKNYAKIDFQINQDDTIGQDDRLCYMFSVPSERVTIYVETTNESQPAYLFTNENSTELLQNQTINVTDKSGATTFVISATNNSIITVKGSNQLYSDFDSKLTRFYNVQDVKLSENDPKDNSISYIIIKGKVAWWIWTIMFGVVGIYWILFMIFGCGRSRDSNDVPLYYWHTSDYLPMKSLLSERDM